MRTCGIFLIIHKGKMNVTSSALRMDILGNEKKDRESAVALGLEIASSHLTSFQCVSW